MGLYYSVEKNVQLLVSLLKQHGIKKVIASPGTTNICLVESLKYDGNFEIFSAPDERSAAYIACGMAAESNETIVLTCTGATASRNYMPALTEAYYRHLSILVLTPTLPESRLYQNFPQAIDRTVLPNDTVVMNVQLPYVYSEVEEWGNCLKINNAILESKKYGGAPVLINWTTQCSIDFSQKTLPVAHKISKYKYSDDFPQILSNRVALFIGNFKKMNEDLISAIDEFCEKFNGVVLCDHTSNYKGKYGVLGNIIANQELFNSVLKKIPLLIYIGDVSGSYMNIQPEEVWRINPDGMSRDCFKKVKNIFQMTEIEFFTKINSTKENNLQITTYYDEWKTQYNSLINKIPDLPFSNIWIAKVSSELIPKNSILHLGILNSLRSWNFFELKNKNIYCFSNTGGFGIDGPLSTVIGASLCNLDRLYFLVTGDLAFFYDMNALGNRHVGNNLRIIVINNGIGTEFKNYNHNGAIFKDEANKYIAAGGHYGNKSKELLKNYAENLGFKYLSAENKTQFEEKVNLFFNTKNNNSIIFEIFTTSENESDALKIMNTLQSSLSGNTKNMVKNVLGKKGTELVSKIINK